LPISSLIRYLSSLPTTPHFLLQQPTLNDDSNTFNTPESTPTTDYHPTMASPPPGEQIPSLQAGQKRKRDEGETDAKNECRNETQDEKTAETIDEDIEDDGNAKVDIRTLVPDNYEPENENEEEQDGSDEENESAIEDNTNYPKHDESDEPFPPCVYYDEAIDDIEERFTLIAQRIYELLEGRNSSSKSLAAHKNKADELGEMPSTELIRIAILGGAGAGKSSLLNAVTAKPDLAKSVSFHIANDICRHTDASTAQ
jgi:hypothetical protein